MLGLAFVAGQLVAWRELDLKGLYVASNPGSFFFYLLTAAHGIHLLGGILALTYIILAGKSLAKSGKRETDCGIVRYLLALHGRTLALFAGFTFMTIQQ